jgi:GMP synthase (glutamine-hydrolysing)
LSNCILHIFHGEQREDRVSRILLDLGFDVQWVNPVRGEHLPTDRDNYAGVVVYGGVHSVNDDLEHVRQEQAWINQWIEEDRPYLGLCLGGQFLARALNAKVGPHPEARIETGFNAIYPVNGGNDVIPETLYAYQWHNEGFDLPENCELLASGKRFANQAFRYRPHIYGFQFHPEVSTEVMMIWFQEGGHALVHPDATPPASQLRDAHVFDHKVETWTQNFLTKWTGCFPG